MIKYDVVKSNCRHHGIEGFMVEINKRLNDGWVLAGGVAVLDNHGYTELIQAMTIETDES